MEPKQAKPFFIVSSGRSGTQMMEKLFAGFPNVEMHHEYLCTHVQPLAVRYAMGLIDTQEACQQLMALHGAAVQYSERDLWGDSSNKLSWLIEPLIRLFPQARFIHIVRDGRKVASSFLHKLGNECYDDRSTTILQNYIDGESSVCPPPEKKYWWNVAPRGSLTPFRRYNQFQRIVHHWTEINRVILEQFARLNSAQYRTYKLEDLVRSSEQVRDMVTFLGLEYREEHYRLFARPHNVNVPEDFPLNEDQTRQFWEIAETMMATFGYTGTEEYRMIYNAEVSEVVK